MKKIILFLSFFLFSTSLLISQNTKEVSVKGVGLNRDEAIQDALRTAVGQAVGIAVESETKVENFAVIKDAVSTNTKGVVTTYKITKETPLSSTYEVEMTATVSLDPLKASVASLEQLVGGIRFLVLYDSRKFSPDSVKYLDYTIERFNEKLKLNEYRYIEKERFDALKTESAKILNTDTSQVTYVQKLGLFADAQFLIMIKDVVLRIEDKGDGIKQVKATIEAKAYDNCVAEGLGTVYMEGDWKIMTNIGEAAKLSISSAIEKNYSHLMLMFSQSIMAWTNNGAPYELRFYGLGTPRNMRGLIDKLQADADFGGTMEPVQTNDFIKLNCTFKKKPYQMYTKVLDYADAIPELKAKVIDAKLQYGRQISFAAQNTAVPEAEQLKNVTTAVDNKGIKK
jgi:hypothetical protein